MAQLPNPDGSEFSAPILTAEAGIYGDVGRGFYCYPEKEPPAEPRQVDEHDLLAEEAGADPLFDPDLG